MTSDDSEKPNGKSHDDARNHGPPNPAGWVRRFIGGIKAGGDILDVACGAGRHMRLALEQGYRVTGIDIDVSKLDDLAERKDVSLIEADLEAGHPFPLRDLRYEGVIVTNYLWRPILPEIVGCVADDGLLIYETFSEGHERKGKPSNPDFLLKRNELLDAVMDKLVVVAFEYGLRPDKQPKIVQRVAACGPDHDWADRKHFPLNGH